MDLDTLRARLVAPAGPYAALDVVASTSSTNHDLRAAAAQGAADRTVLIAEQQTAGQGRRGRNWVSPPGSGLYVSVLYRPTGVPAVRLPWLTLLAGVALVRAVRSYGADAVLKWPNDLLLGQRRRKAAGVLAETTSGLDATLVLGMGLNVAPLPPDVPAGVGGLEPTSLGDELGTAPDRTEVAVRLLTELATLEETWRRADGDPFVSGLHEEYRAYCATFGQQVRVELSGTAELRGTAMYLEGDGTLVVRSQDGAEHSVSAGDVVHLRPAD
ncbi:biotin--[acetyl-CoA-carboxylase] ligase [Solihabitans fulvus]|uniref:biotin--[biotin carboxyl-carrier protein] ligase n=1 Tax=Solihabitans fulvus TaxID=1892852 RepID=A0A5B2WMJ7_9PSEU|nr:biotin--[acetyl-CoA-carboxylase] ligase [Solihabitans fulvus]